MLQTFENKLEPVFQTHTTIVEYLKKGSEKTGGKTSNAEHCAPLEGTQK